MSRHISIHLDSALTLRTAGLSSIVLLAAVGFTLGCGAELTPIPVFDTLHRPLVLTEELRLAGPASENPNRFLTGWGSSRRSRRQQRGLAVAGTGRLQVVQLVPRTRELILELDREPGPASKAEVRVGDGAWQPLSLSRKTPLSLPGDAGPGRLSVDVRPLGDVDLRVRRAELSEARSAGAVELRNGDLIQSGFSAVEVVHHTGGKGRLSGTLQPPSNPRPEQSFHIELEHEGESRRVFSWNGTDSGSKAFDLRLKGPGFVRLRFLALGGGDPGRWRDLMLELPAPKQSEVTVPPPAPPKIIVLYIMDALRADHLGHLGGPEGISPTIDRLALEGSTFTNHFSVAPNTVPSTKSLLTGNRYLRLGGTRLPDDSGPTLAERFSSSGIVPGLFSSNGNVGAWLRTGRGYQSEASRVLHRGNQSRKRADYNNSAEFLHAESLRWLDSLPGGSRAFVHIQTVNPHNPYDPPEPYRSRFVRKNGSDIDGSTRVLKDIRRLRQSANMADQQRLRDLYAASVAYNDAMLEDFLDRLLQRYDREEILLIVTSDHGEELFDHGGVLHGYTLYDEMLRIPLVFWWPGTIAAGMSVNDLTDNVDLHATLAALASGQTGSDEFGGDPLWPYLIGELAVDSGKPVIFAAASSLREGMFMARSERIKVVDARRSGNNRGMGQGRGRGHDAEYVFDLVSDPAESENLSGSLILEADWLRQQLQAWVEIGSQLESGEEVDDLDDTTRESLEALGYL